MTVCDSSWSARPVLVVLLVGLTAGFGHFAAAQESADVILEVGFGNDCIDGDFTNLASGFIGDHNYANPPADRIDPLHPRHWKWWRNVHRPYSYTGERFQHGLGSLWTAQFSPGWGCGHPADPCAYPGTFREFCQAEASSKLSQGMNPRWDFWPEPGWPGVGGGHPFNSGYDFAYWLRECALGLAKAYDDTPGYSRDDLVLIAPSVWKFYDIYRVLFKQGSAGCNLLQTEAYFGPSYDCDYNEPTPFGLVELLGTYHEDFEVDLISAHQFNDYNVDFWPFLFAALEDALQAEIDDLALNPMEITINEHIGPSYNLCADPTWADPDSQECDDPIHETNNFLRPGHTVRAWATLHGGSVESAVKACWEDPTTGLSGCNEKALNGLLVGDATMARRPVWHVYRLYGEMAGHSISQDAVLSTYEEDGAPFDPLGGVATRDDTLGLESYKLFIGYSNLMYQPELEIPGNEIYESFQGPYRWTEQVDLTLSVTGLDPDCASVEAFTTIVSGADYVAPMETVTRVPLGTTTIVDGGLTVGLTMLKNDALLFELEGFSGAAGCLTDLDGDGYSDPVADASAAVFQDGFECGDTSRWSDHLP